MNKFKRHPGNSIIEYVLPMGLIVVAVLAAIPMVIEGLQAMAANSLNAKAGSNTGVLQIASFGSNTGRVFSGTEATVQVTLANGNTITLDNVPTNLAENIETSGISGTTEKIVGAIDQLMNELTASGELDPIKAESLQVLANKGHRIARIIEIIEKAAIDSKTDGISFFNKKIVYEGRERYLSELAQEIGWDGFNSTGPFGLEGEGATGGTAMMEFVNEFKRVREDGTLNDATAQKVVEVLVNQIVLLGDTINDITGQARYYNYQSGMNSLHQYAGDAIASTDSNSGNICAIGGDGDSGTSCEATPVAVPAPGNP